MLAFLPLNKLKVSILENNGAHLSLCEESKKVLMDCSSVSCNNFIKSSIVAFLRRHCLHLKREVWVSMFPKEMIQVWRHCFSLLLRWTLLHSYMIQFLFSCYFFVHTFIRLKISYYIVNIVWHDQTKWCSTLFISMSKNVHRRHIQRLKSAPEYSCIVQLIPTFYCLFIWRTSGSLYLYAQLQIQITDFVNLQYSGEFIHL